VAGLRIALVIDYMHSSQAWLGISGPSSIMGSILNCVWLCVHHAGGREGMQWAGELDLLLCAGARRAAHSNAINLRSEAYPRTGRAPLSRVLIGWPKRFSDAAQPQVVPILRRPKTENRLYSQSKLELERARFWDALRWLPATLRGCDRARAARARARGGGAHTRLVP
jgi:hypothetical protein